MQAIETKAIPFTNTKPMRIKATCARGSKITSVDNFHEASHIEAVMQLISKFVLEDVKTGTPATHNPWFTRKIVTGTLKNGNYVHVFGK